MAKPRRRTKGMASTLKVGAARMLSQDMATARQMPSNLPSVGGERQLIHASLQGELMLVCALLQQAIAAYHGAPPWDTAAEGLSKATIRARERRWFKGEVESAISFVECCEYLGICPQYTWKQINNDPSALLRRMRMIRKFQEPARDGTGI